MLASTVAVSAVVSPWASGIAFAANAVTISGGQIFRMDCASDGVTVGGTFDFQVVSIDSAANTTGFLNVVADLDFSGMITSDEWIIENIPMFLDDGLTTQPLLSVWFDPGPFDLSVGTPYETWATIEDSEIAYMSGYLSWHYSDLPAGGMIWGENDPQGQVEEPPAGGTAVLTGKFAKPIRRDVRDIEQKRNECGPTSAAASLRWLAIKHDFNDKLPAADDDLIKELMKAMTGSDARPFCGLTGNQLFDGKKKYIDDKKRKLPLIVKGGNTDPNAKGGKAFDFIARELDAGEDVEFLIDWPGPGSHWVTAIGYAIYDNRLFLLVYDPDDGKTGAVTWELKRDGTFVNPKGRMLWAVSESSPPIGGFIVPVNKLELLAPWLWSVALMVAAVAAVAIRRRAG